MGIDKTDVKMINKRTVLSLIRKHDDIYKTEIARLANLSVPTVMKIVDGFIENKIVIESGVGESSGGKPPTLLRFNKSAYYLIGIDTNAVSIVIVVTDLAAGVIYRNSIKSDTSASPEIVISQIIFEIERAIEHLSIPKESILGIGLAVSGVLDKKNGIAMYSPGFEWDNVNVLGPIRSHFNMHVCMNNNSRCMAMAERWFGVAGEVDNFICLNLIYGIGAAIFIDGKLYEGKNETAGEFGHVTMERNGPLCRCGNYGCLETLASAYAIEKKAKVYIENGAATSIAEKAKNKDIDAKMVFDAAKEGDKLALEIIAEACEYLGIALAGLVNLLNPDTIILSDTIAGSGKIIIDGIQNAFNKRKLKYAGVGTKIITSRLGPDIAAIGATAFLLEKLIDCGGDASQYLQNSIENFS